MEAMFSCSLPIELTRLGLSLAGQDLILNIW